MQKPLPRWYVKIRQRLDDCFAPENLKNVLCADSSPEGFSLKVEEYVTDISIKYYKGTLYRPCGDAICELRSTARKFWHLWVSRGKKLYLVCNEHEQGYTIIDVKEGAIYPYLDRSGWGFSWDAASSDGDSLIVKGHYASLKEETIRFDFSNPTDLPLPLFRAEKPNKTAATTNERPKKARRGGGSLGDR